MTMTNPRRRILVTAWGLAAAALLLAGCAKDATAGASAPELPAKSSAVSSTSTTPAGPAVNERGLIPKAIGEEAGLGNTPGANLASFSIDRVTVDPPCQEYGIKPDSGHTLLLDMRVATGSDTEAVTYLSGVLNPFSFSEVGKDGVTRTAQPGSCTDYKANLPNQFGVNQKYSGTIELVVPEASGILALQNPPGGWEWTY